MTSRLKEWRTKRGLSLHQLSDLSGVFYLTIHYIENGETSADKLTYGTAKKLQKALKLRRVEQLFKD